MPTAVQELERLRGKYGTQVPPAPAAPSPRAELGRLRTKYRAEPSAQPTGEQPTGRRELERLRSKYAARPAPAVPAAPPPEPQAPSAIPPATPDLRKPPEPGKEVPPRLRAGVSIPTPEAIQRRPMDWKLPEESLQRLAPPAWKTRAEGLLASAAGLAGATPHGAALLHKVLIPWMDKQDPGLGDRFKAEIARQQRESVTRIPTTAPIPKWVPFVGAGHDPVAEVFSLWMNIGLVGAVGEAVAPGMIPAGPALAPPPVPATAGSVLASVGKQGAHTAGVFGSLSFAQEMNRSADIGKALEEGSKGALLGAGIGVVFGAALNAEQIRALVLNRAVQSGHAKLVSAARARWDATHKPELESGLSNRPAYLAAKKAVSVAEKNYLQARAKYLGAARRVFAATGDKAATQAVKGQLRTNQMAIEQGKFEQALQDEAALLKSLPKDRGLGAWEMPGVPSTGGFRAETGPAAGPLGAPVREIVGPTTTYGQAAARLPAPPRVPVPAAEAGGLFQPPAARAPSMAPELARRAAGRAVGPSEAAIARAAQALTRAAAQPGVTEQQAISAAAAALLRSAQAEGALVSPEDAQTTVERIAAEKQRTERGVAVTEGRELPTTPDEPTRMAERLEQVAGAEYQSSRVSEMKTLEVMAELKQQHSGDALKAGFGRWLQTPQGQREGAGYQGEMKAAGQIETFARLLLSDAPSAVSAMSQAAPAAEAAPAEAPGVGAEAELARVKQEVADQGLDVRVDGIQEGLGVQITPPSGTSGYVHPGESVADAAARLEARMAKAPPAAEAAPVPPAEKVAPAVGAEPEVAPEAMPGALPKAVEAEPTPVREPLAPTGTKQAVAATRKSVSRLAKAKRTPAAIRKIAEKQAAKVGADAEEVLRGMGAEVVAPVTPPAPTAEYEIINSRGNRTWKRTFASRAEAQKFLEKKVTAPAGRMQFMVRPVATEVPPPAPSPETAAEVTPMTDEAFQDALKREVPSDTPSILGDLKNLHRNEQGAVQIPPPLPAEEELPDARDTADPRVGKLMDEMFHGRDINLQENKIREARHQLRVAALSGEKRYGPKSRLADMLMFLYADLKGKGEQAAKWTPQLSATQQALVQKALALSPSLRALADQILEENAIEGQRALDAGVIRNVIENYAARLWKQPGKPRGRAARFATQTARAKQRTLESILHGWSEGHELAVKTLTGAQRAATDEIAQTVAARNLIKMARKAGVVDTRRREADWERINHPNFSAWDWAGNLDVETPLEPGETLAPGARVRALDRNNTGTVESVNRAGGSATVRFYNKETGAQATVDLPLEMLERTGPAIKRAPDLFATEGGDLYIRRQMYGLPEFSRFLNKILTPSVLYDWVPGIRFITHYNAQIKRAILLTAFFHHQAILRSYSLGSRGINPKKAYREGREAVMNFVPEMRELVGAGLTLGDIRDWNEAARAEQTRIGAMLDRMPMVSSLKAGLKFVADGQVRFLFGRMLPFMKAQAALLEYRADMEKHADSVAAGTMTRNDIARAVASHINDDFGGLHLERMGRSPTTQHIFQLLFLAPDWTESNVRTAVKAAGGSLDPIIGGAWGGPALDPDGKPVIGPDGRPLRGPRGLEAAIVRRFWWRVLLKGVGFTVLSNLMLSFFDDKDFWERYQLAWKAGNLRWLDIDVTPIFRALGGGDGKRKYFSFLGHLRDPLKFVVHPIRSAKHKGSVATRIVLDAVYGSDWAGRRFTTWQELLGIDDKGEYKTTRAGKYFAGDPKGGKLAGRLVAPGWSGGKPLSWKQVPSYVLYESRSALPIPAQNTLGWLAGEMDAWDAILKSMGVMVSQVRQPKEEGK